MWRSQSTKAKTSPYSIKRYPGPVLWSVKGRKKELQVPVFVFFPETLEWHTPQKHRWVMWRHCGACPWSQLNSEADRSTWKQPILQMSSFHITSDTYWRNKNTKIISLTIKKAPSHKQTKNNTMFFFLYILKSRIKKSKEFISGSQS